MTINQKKYRSFLSLIALLCLCGFLSAQEIVNLTNIPRLYPGNFPILHRDIHEMDGKIIVPLLKSYNAIFQYLPNVEIDSFHVPEGSFSAGVGSTLYAEYEPEVGFVDTEIVNYREEPNLFISDGYIGFSSSTSVSGINGHLFASYPVHPDTFPDRKHIIAVYDKFLDTMIYTNIFKVGGGAYDMRNVIDGDYIYVNIPLSDDEYEDLIFMGDTLTYPFSPYGDHRNYLRKINYVTGEKEWTHMIGYGYLESMMMDDEGRINVVIEQPGPPSIDDELLIDLDDYLAGYYDHMIYRISQEGEPLGHTILHT